MSVEPSLYRALIMERFGETIEDLGIQVALALEITIEPAVRAAGMRHDLGDRNIFEAAAIEQPAGAVDDLAFDFGAMAGGVGHGRAG